MALFFFPGTLLGYDEFPVATDSFSQTYPLVVFDGEDYFTVYLDRRGGEYSFYSRFISHDGTVTAEQLAVPSHPAMSFMPGLARGADNFLYTWSRQRGVFNYDRDGMARLLGPDGSPVSGIIQVSGALAQHSPGFMRTAFDGEHYLVIWQDGLPTQGARILGQFVCATDYNLVGSNFLIRPEGLATNVAQIYPDILFDGNHYLVVWDDNRSGERSIYGWFLDTEGSPVGDDFAISDQPQRQMLVRAAFNGQHYMAVWSDRRHGNKSGVFAQRFDGTGELVGDEIAISPLQNNEERSWPRVGSNGEQFMVAWEQQNLSKGEAPPAGGPRLLIKEAAGVDPHKQTVWYEVHGRIINADGSYYSDEMPVGVNQFHQQEPSVCGQGDQFLVLWQDSRVNNQYYDLYGRFAEAEAAPALAPPQNLEASFSGEAIELLWESPAEKDAVFLHYRLYKDGELLAGEVAEEMFSDFDFEQNTSYGYHVTAIYDLGESDPSNTVEVDIPTLHVSVSFFVYDVPPLQGALVWLEGYGEQHTDVDGIAQFEAVGVSQELAWEVSLEGYFPESGLAVIEEEDVEIAVALNQDDTKVNEPTVASTLHVSPNPALSGICVASELPIHRLEVLNVAGHTLMNVEVKGKGNVHVEISSLAAGMYMLRAVLGDRSVQVVPFIKQ